MGVHSTLFQYDRGGNPANFVMASAVRTPTGDVQISLSSGVSTFLVTLEPETAKALGEQLIFFSKE